jgi:tetratricopeptide (TPR) repeat protein/O-antigen ligase
VPGTFSGTFSTISLYPESTRRQLAVFTFGLVAFTAAACVFQSSRSQIWLAGLIACNGAALAFFGLVQKLSWNGMLYWTVPLSNGGGPFGPFVNRNNGGGYLNMCLGIAAAWSLSLVAVSAAKKSEWENGEQRTGLSGFLDNCRESFAQLDAWKLTAVSFVAMIVAGVFCSLSRGAIVSMWVALIPTAAFGLLARRRHMPLWLATTMLMLGVGLVTWAGMQDAVLERLGTLWNTADAAKDRVEHWTDVVRSVPDFWLAGSGLGTYRYVYGMYLTHAFESWYYHAENVYLELLVEGGVFAFLSLFTAGILVVLAAWHVLRNDRRTMATAMAIGCVFVLATQAIHAGSDFGLYIPANMLLFATICGAISGRAVRLKEAEAETDRSRRHGEDGAKEEAAPQFTAQRFVLNSPSTPNRIVNIGRGIPVGVSRRHGVEPQRHREDRGQGTEGLDVPATSSVSSVPLRASVRGLSFALLFGLLICSIPGIRIIHGASIAEAAQRSAFIEKLDRTTPLSSLMKSIDQLTAAAQVCPADADLQATIAERQILAYRVVSFPKLQATRLPTQTDDDLWNLTSPTVIYALCQRLDANRQTEELAAFRDDPDVQRWLVPAMNRLFAARQASPICAKTHLRLAELSPLFAATDQCQAHIACVKKLSPANIDHLYLCGVLELSARRNEAAYASWQRCLALSTKYLDAITAMSGRQVAIWDLAEKILPPDPALLLSLARKATGQKDSTILREYLLARTERLLASQPPSTEVAEASYLRGALCLLRGQAELAVAKLRQAVELRPDELDWRFELAQALQVSGDIQEAHRQARWCARMAPRNVDYKTFVNEMRK